LVLFFTVILSSYIVCDDSYNDHNKGKRLIAFSDTETVWMSAEEVEQLIVTSDNFIDITDHQNVVKANIKADPLPTQPVHKILAAELFSTIDIANVQANLNTLTTFNTRYYTSATGAEAAKWILEQFTTIIGTVDERNITVEQFAHTWMQPSVIATIPGWGPNKEQIVVIGAHEDSVGSSSTGRSPGADDDGTGTVTVIEIFRVLVAGKIRPDRTLQFITYAGEEAGLLGSQAIAASYAAKAVPVHAVLQLDMTGYGSPDEVGVMNDLVDPTLTGFVKILIDSYTVFTWYERTCGYGCSDHASWTRNGYRSSFPFEVGRSSSNPYIHSANDIISHLSFDKIGEFVKLGVGFAVELADIVIEK